MKGTVVQENKRNSLSRTPIYVIIVLINVVVFAGVALVYLASNRSYTEKLYNENVKNITNLSSSSANAADIYIDSMGVKIDDIISYIKANSLTYEQTVKYLGKSNTNTDRRLEIVRSGIYNSATGLLEPGDFTGVSVSKVTDENSVLVTIERVISYEKGYDDLKDTFADYNDKQFDGIQTAPEFTDADTKLKSFAIYRHITLTDKDGVSAVYTILLTINSERAMNVYNLQNEYVGQSTVLAKSDGDYIIKSEDFKGINFFDYISEYNDLTLDMRTALVKKVESAVGNTIGKNHITLFYKNHQDVDCVFCVIPMDNNWYSITSVPLSSFNSSNTRTNFSLIILLLFILLFVIDGFMTYLFAKEMKNNVSIAKKATEEANEANLAKSRFLSTMSHELRTPLNAIIGLVALSRDNMENPVMLTDYFNKIDSSSKLLLQLISDILDVSAIESDKMKINYNEFDLTKLISSLSAIYYNQCSTKGVEFNVILKNFTFETLVGDSIRLNQILLNFLSNAVKFTPSGGKVTLKVEQMSDKDDVVLIRFDVIDTGCGISDELKTRLFKPFEQEKREAARKYGGTGLGLSIAKNLTELMHGTIDMESEEGVGSRFSVQIPFNISTPKGKNQFSSIAKMRVLVAINDSETREYIGQILGRFGVERTLTASVADAIALLKEERKKDNPYNLCMLDWKMPDFGAVSATKKIRKDFSADELMIMVIAYDLSVARPPCIAAGANLVFSKPVFPSALYNTLEEISTGYTQPTDEFSKEYDFNGIRVLLVEDSPLNLEIATLLLQKVGFSVETADDGQSGYNKFIDSEEGYYDLILMDVQMPIMNGYQSTKAIRTSSHPQASTIPILAMTADAFAEDVEKALAAGMNSHLSKPIEPDLMYATLNAFLSSNDTPQITLE